MQSHFISLKTFMADAQLSYLKNKVSLYPKSDTYSSLVKVSLPYNGQCLQGTRLDKNLPSLLGLVSYCKAHFLV